MKKLVLVVTCLDSKTVLERWQFDVECDKSAKGSRSEPYNVYSDLHPTKHLAFLCDFVGRHSIKIPAGGNHEPPSRVTLTHFGFQDC